jgi:hypothetical protein
VRITIGELRRLIREVSEDNVWGGSNPEEMYEEELADDPALKKKSVYVPDDIKDSIGHWMKAMGLSHSKKKRSRSA